MNIPIILSHYGSKACCVAAPTPAQKACVYVAGNQALCQFYFGKQCILSNILAQILHHECFHASFKDFVFFITPLRFPWGSMEAVERADERSLLLS